MDNIEYNQEVTKDEEGQSRLADVLERCPFCGAGISEIVENGRMWNGMCKTEAVSVSVRHWCEKIEGQPSRMIERIGKDRASAIAMWNMRSNT